VLAPGNGVGSFGAGPTTIAGTYACEIDGATDLLSVTGVLNLSAATDILEISTPGGGATQPVYVIATFTSRTGTFDTVNGLPPDYAVVYSATQITLVRPTTVYDTWVNGFFPGETNVAIVGPNADPDSDRSTNAMEFALGGSPANGSNNPKVYHLRADSSDAGTAAELLLTIAVRTGTPVFAGSPSPTATHDGFTYTVEGSLDLADFTSAVSVVTPVTTGLPAAPAGYTYRTFSLDASNGLPTKGFLRVSVTP
jgi:hypothetical protein